MKEKLIDAVLDQIKKDVEDYHLTSIEQLIKTCHESYLINYLSENGNHKFGFSNPTEILQILESNKYYAIITDNMYDESDNGTWYHSFIIEKDNLNNHGWSHIKLKRKSQMYDWEKFYNYINWFDLPKNIQGIIVEKIKKGIGKNH